MLKLLLQDWGFTRQGWRSGEHGEYLVLDELLRPEES